MKKIALLGATGGTGNEFLKQALEAGYPIKVLVRTPEKLEQDSPQLEVIQGDVLNQEDVDELVQGADLVVSLFGHVKGSPDWLQTEGTKNIVEAMEKYDVPRIISLSGGGLPFPEKDEPGFIDYLIRFIMRIFAAQILKDAKKHAEVLRNSDIDWVIVRGPRLTYGEKRGDYRVGWVGVNSGTQISRADLADFILKQVEEDMFDGQMPFVSY